MSNHFGFDSPCFITGHPRSGTNLMYRLLDGHTKVHTPPAGKEKMAGGGKYSFLRRFVYSDWASYDKMTTDLAVFSHLSAVNGFLSEYFMKQSTGICNDVPQSLRTVCKHVLHKFGFKDDVHKIWCEKNHNLEFYFHMATRVFCNPKMLFVVRDPRNVWSSWKTFIEKESMDASKRQFSINVGLHFMEEAEAMRMGEGRFSTFEDLCRFYRVQCANPEALSRCIFEHCVDGLEQVVQAENFPLTQTKEGRFAWNWSFMSQKALFHESRSARHFKIVRYEDLTRNTESVMRDVAHFLEIEFEDNLTIPTRAGVPIGANSSYGTLNMAVVPSDDERYKTVLTPEEAHNILSVLIASGESAQLADAMANFVC